MKNDLTCGVVRDLLPSYIEGLLGEDSREAVDRHLETCPACTAQKEAMAARTESEPEEAAKEVDYLRRVKKGTAKKIVLAMVCTVLAVALGLLAREFVIGRTPDPEMIDIESAQVDGENNLTLLLDTYWGAYELRGLKSDTKDGVLTYTAREVRVNLFQGLFMQETRGGMTGYWKQIPLSIPLDGLTEVWVCGRLVWQDGMVISKECLDLLDAKTPYCGDAPALGRIANILQIGNLGAYTTELQTSKEPYRWTLNFSQQMSQPEEALMRRNMYVILALVDNLGEVRYTLPDIEHIHVAQWSLGGDMQRERTGQGIASITGKYNAANGTALEAKEDIRDYTQSPAEFQQFIDVLNWYYREYDR